MTYDALMHTTIVSNVVQTRIHLLAHFVAILAHCFQKCFGMLQTLKSFGHFRTIFGIELKFSTK